MDYKDWLAYKSKLEGRDLSKDEQDYDLESYFKSLKYNDKDYKPKQGIHLEDTYKKPNHPTFSNQSMYNIPGIQEGGNWSSNKEGKWAFKPSELNLKNMPAEQMQQYFSEADPNAELDLSEKQNKVRRSALESILKK
jgi:hypothetical protein